MDQHSNHGTQVANSDLDPPVTGSDASDASDVSASQPPPASIEPAADLQERVDRDTSLSANQTDQTEDGHEQQALQGSDGSTLETGSTREKVVSSSGSSERAGRSWWSRCKQISLDTWFLEAGALVLSLMSLTTLVIILVIYNQRALPSMPYGITINAIIAILTVVFESTLLFAMSAAISQLKWCSLRRRSHRLNGIQLWDDASRGPMGALTLLFSHQRTSTAALGAIVTALAVLNSPFVQQIVRYPSRQIVDAGQIATMRKSSMILDRPGDSNFVRAAIAPIYSDASVFHSVPTCPTGNCRWPTFQSVGWCSRCTKNATSLMTYTPSCDHLAAANVSGSTCTFSFGSGNGIAIGPDGSAFNPESYPMAITWVVDAAIQWPNFTQRPVFTPGDPLLTIGYVALNYTFNMLSFNESFQLPFWNANAGYAEKCTLTPCLQEYNVAVSSGIGIIDISTITYGKLIQRNGSGWPSKSLCWQSSDKAVKWHYNKTIGDYSTWDGYGFCGIDLLPYGLGLALSNKLHNEGMGDLSVFLGNNNATALIIGERGLESVMSSVAASLTQLTHSNNGEQVNGEVLSAQTFVDVRWAWLTLPIVLEVVGIFVLVKTTRLTRRHKAGLWKSSILALLFHGLDRSILDEAPIENTASR